jgi:hypothetical protein
MKLTKPTWLIILLLVFATSFAFRAAAIRLTPRFDHYVDLEIYRASGDLILRGANPYDFSDKIAVRVSLREQSRDTAFRQLDQARWDYYASSNLPMNLLFFAGLSAISDTPWMHRYSYAFLDSILSALLVWFVIRHWHPAAGGLSSLLTSRGFSPNTALLAERLAIGVALGCFSPVLLKYGGVLPEDKGIQILLMLATLACYLSDRESIWFWGGGVFLGLSIAFKGLGIFLAPLFVSKLLKSGTGSRMRPLVFALVVAGVVVVWLPPFWPGVAEMVKTRLLLASRSLPQHSSIWVTPYVYFPSAWETLRLGMVLVMCGVSLIGFLRKRIGLELLCTTLLFVFVSVWLINGSMDRQNIGLLPALLVLGTRGINVALICMAPYFLAGVGGLVSRFPMGEFREGTGIMLFLVSYLAILCWFSFAGSAAEEGNAVQLAVQ